MTLPKEMYPGKVNSPETTITQDIGEAVTSIQVEDASVFSPGPNLAVIGIDATAETIKYTSINENILVGCERGFQGVARGWESGTIIARNITEYDVSSAQENIKSLEERKAEKTEIPTELAQLTDDSLSRLVTDTEKNTWSAKAEITDIPTKLSELEKDINFDENYEPKNNNIQSHISSTSNPHDVTKEQIGLGNVENYEIASQPEAEEGTVTNKYMTPLRVKNAIDNKVKTDVPENAKFTDTIYTHPDTHSLDIITETENLKVMTKAERDKLQGIEENATNYTHPSSHSADMIDETTDKRFVSDTEKTTWNNKLTPPSGGNEGQFLQKTSNGYEWADVGGEEPEIITLTGERGKAILKKVGNLVMFNFTEGTNSSNLNSLPPLPVGFRPTIVPYRFTISCIKDTGTTSEQSILISSNYKFSTTTSGHDKGFGFYFIEYPV